MYRLTIDVENKIEQVGKRKVRQMRDVCRSFGQDKGLRGRAAEKLGIRELFGCRQDFYMEIIAEVSREVNARQQEILYVLSERNVL